MNTFNRVVVILLLLAVMVILTRALVVPRPTIGALQRALIGLDASLARINRALLSIGGIALAVLVDVLCIWLLWAEIRRPRPKAIKVQTVSSGEAELTLDSVARRLETHIGQLAGIVSVKPTVVARRGGVEVSLDLETSPEIEVPAKTEEIYQAVKEAIEDKMGVKVRKVRVNIKHAPYRKEQYESPPRKPSV